MKLQIVGGGKMGEALLGGLLERAWAQPQELVVVEPLEERRQELGQVYSGIVVAADPMAGLDAMIAVKPQHVLSVAASLAEHGVRRVLSIAAGVTSGSIEAALPGGAVVRAMPNTPSLIGEGAAAIAPGAHAQDADLDWAESILGSVGVVVRVDEADLDAVTALSGSGPAYVFAMAEALIAGATAQGLSPAVADVLARQTLLGAARLMSDSGEDPAVLRANVTSPGGTTAAGLDAMSDGGYADLIASVLRAARDRSVELSQPSDAIS